MSKLPCFGGLSDKQQLVAIKLINVVMGLITMGIAFGVAYMSGVIESSQLMTAATSGPLLGVFLLAMFCPACNWKVSPVSWDVGGKPSNYDHALCLPAYQLTTHRAMVRYEPPQFRYAFLMFRAYQRRMLRRNTWSGLG